MKTLRGIYLNLNESEYKFTFNALTFYFSSKFYKEKFINEFQNYIKKENEKNFIKYKINCSNDIYYLISFYKKVEKRGFRIIDENTKKEITENVIFANKIVTF